MNQSVLEGVEKKKQKEISVVEKQELRRERKNSAKERTKNLRNDRED